MALPHLDVPLAIREEERVQRLNIDDLPIKSFRVRDVAGMFNARLISFLKTRFGSSAALSHHMYTSPGGPPGLLFTVTTNTLGLKVHYTHQYYVNPSYIFGAPTTPVSGYIPPGRWHFGYSQGTGPVTFDLTNIYDVPLASSAHLSV
jgi:hypothetical protein